MENKEEKFDLHQSMMNEVYDKWRTPECKDMGRLEVAVNFFSKAHKVAVQLGNFNYQVHNGGFTQWFDSGYGEQDLCDLREYFNYAKTKNISFSKDVLDILDKIDINFVCLTCNGKGKIICSYCDGLTYLYCGVCEGLGIGKCSCSGKDKSCSECEGSGDIECACCDGTGEETCQECDGYGYVECEDCNGTGDILCNWDDFDKLDDKLFDMNEDDLLSMYNQIIKLYM